MAVVINLEPYSCEHITWCLPIAYFLCTGAIKGKNFKNILIATLNELHQMVLKICAIISDQVSNNSYYAKRFGISRAQPFLVLNNQKIYWFFGLPHLIKLLRNTLINHNILIENGLVASWAGIQEIYEKDKRNKVSNLLTKVTDEHIYPNKFRKMKVKLAMQVLHKMYLALKVYEITSQLMSLTVIADCLT